MSSITYDSGTNTITIVGYTESSPCTLTDIYNADVAGGWGVITKQGDVQFYFSGGVRLVIGDGSTETWFGDTNKLVEISDLSGSDWQIFMEKKANANIRFGTVISGKRTKDGCAFYHYPSDNAFSLVDANNTSGCVDFYSCSFYVDLSAIYNCTGLKLYNCSIYGDLRVIDSNNIDIYNYIMNDGASISQGSTGTYDLVSATDVSSSLTHTGSASSDYTFKNVYARNVAAIARGYSSSINIYLVNFDVDAWAFTYFSYSGKFYRQYEFDLKVIDKDGNNIDGASVKIWDKNSTLIVDTTTGADGTIATQTITRGYYNQANGNTLQDYSPHRIKVEKAGYTAYEADFILEEKTDWLIALQGVLKRNPAMTGGMV